MRSLLSGLRADLLRASFQFYSLSFTAQLPQQFSIVHQKSGDVRMISAKSFLKNWQSAFEERLGVSVFALCEIEVRQEEKAYGGP
jgi:hypothetical protein